ncbi:MAG: FAD-dependent oxidoreductase [Actinomycetota bacterium]|nr:FAD-dependent oxidoreductase [Actinomycetota bacterium]
MTERLVVVGGDAAGMTAASRVKQMRGDEVEVVVLEQGSYTSYSACGIPYWVAGDVASADRLVARTPERHRSNGIDVRLHTRATALDLDRRQVSVEGGEPVAYDQLLVATGAVPLRPDLPGLDAPNVVGVQTLDDGARVHEMLGATEASAPSGGTGGPDSARMPQPRDAVVIGAGYIGIEMAEALVRRGYAVTVVDKAPQPMTTLDPELGRIVAEAMQGMGIGLACGVSVEEVETDAEGVATGVRAGGSTYPADVVVLGMGVRPRTELAREAGLPLGDSGGVRVDDRMRVEGYDGLWAAGDCVESWDRIAQRWVHVPLGTHANKQGLVAGFNLAGRDGRFPGIVKTAMSKVCDLEVARTGLGEAEAADLGRDVLTATIETTTRAGYFPGTRPMTVRLMCERADGRLLGAQIVGREGAAIRIDTCATALWAGLTAEEIVMSDLGYAPPFSSVWDPVQVAARALVSQM